MCLRFDDLAIRFKPILTVLYCRIDLVIAGRVPGIRMKRSQNCGLVATIEGLAEPVETHTCTGIRVYAIHNIPSNTTSE
jgi:hypothetical protein